MISLFIVKIFTSLNFQLGEEETAVHSVPTTGKNKKEY